MSIISIISFVICLLIVLSSFRTNADIFSPGRAFGLVWSLVIGLTDLKLSGLQQQWPLEIWIQVLLGPLTFLIGVFVAYIINLNKEVVPVNSMRVNRQFWEVDKQKLFRTITVLFFLFIVSYVIIYLKSGEIPLFSAKPGVARSNFTIFGIGLFLHNVVLIGFLSAVYFVLEKKKLIRKSLLFIFTLTSLTLYAITLQRYQIFLTILMIVAFLYYTTFRINFRSALLIGAIIIVFFYLVSSFRAGELIIYVLYKMSKMKFSPSFAVFTEPYMYVAMNLENFARSIGKTDFFTYGYYTFDFITAITGIKHWISEYFNLNETPFLISSYNTYSAFWTYYRDFGIIGIFFIPLFGGVGISTLYYSLRVKPSFDKITFYGMLLFAVMFSFFNSAFGFLWFVYDLFVLIVVSKYISFGKFK
ncbi:MAG: oligosaccharide repeat unit polymerase [Bacteroidetes bacterium]|nr:oligosaccharide repeat unit polymerase [Bacteroidota bacterium]